MVNRRTMSATVEGSESGYSRSNSTSLGEREALIVLLQLSTGLYNSISRSPGIYHPAIVLNE